MRQQRFYAIVALAVSLFAINAVTRVVMRLWFTNDDSAQDKASIIMFGLLGVVLAVWSFVVAQRRKPSEWLVPDWFFATVGGLLLTVLVGPFISGGQPFSGGAGNFFFQVWVYIGFALLGTLVGYWIAVSLGRDYRSQALKAYTASREAKPRKVVRR